MPVESHPASGVPGPSILTAPPTGDILESSRPFAAMYPAGRRAVTTMCGWTPPRRHREEGFRCRPLRRTHPAGHWPDPAAIRDAGRTGEIFAGNGQGNIRLIVNRVNKKLVAAMHLTVDDVMDRTGLPLLGLVPEDAT